MILSETEQMLMPAFIGTMTFLILAVVGIIRIFGKHR